MSEQYPGGFITSNPPTPAGPYQNSSAYGVWTLSQAAAYQKQGLWPIPGNVASFALFSGGMTNAVSNKAIISANLNTTGSWAYWGDLANAKLGGGVGLGSSTRGLFCGGGNSSTIDYITYASSGSGTTFGTVATSVGTYNGTGGVSNETRGVIMGGACTATSRCRAMAYVTIATLGNTTTFGDLSQNVDNLNQGASSGTRGLIAGGYGDTTGTSNRIEYITIATTGNATTFGNLTAARFVPAGMSSSTRGVWAGGSSTATIDYVTIATTGNATSFGSLTFNAGDASGVNNSTIGCIAYSGGSATNYITIATTGNGTSFGNLALSANGGQLMSCCNNQGGL